MANIGLGLDPTRDIEGTRQVMQDRIWVKEANGLKQSLTAELEAVDAEAQMIAREAKALLDEGNIRGSVERSMDAHNERYAKRMQVIAKASASFGNNPHAKPLLETALTKAQGEHQAVLQMVNDRAAQMEQMFEQDAPSRGPIDPQDVAGMDPAEEQQLRQESPQAFTGGAPAGARHFEPYNADAAGYSDNEEFFSNMVYKGLPDPREMSDDELISKRDALVRPRQEGEPPRYDEEIVADGIQREIEARGLKPRDPQNVAGMSSEEKQQLRAESPEAFTDVRPEYRGMVDKGLPNPETQTDQALVKELRALSKPWKEGDPARYDSELVSDAFKMELERRGVGLPDFKYENYLEDKGLPVPSEQSDDELIKELIAIREGEGGYDSEIVEKAFEREAKRRKLDVPGDYDDPEYRQWLRDQEID